MDVSSDSQNEKETNKNNIFIINENQNEMIKIACYNNFKENNLTTADDEINDETDRYFQKGNQFTPNEEKKTYVSSVEIKAFQNPIQGVFHLFHPWSQLYNYNSIYSKKKTFNTNYQAADDEDSPPHDLENRDDNIRKKIKTHMSRVIILNFNEKLTPINIKFFPFSQCEVTNVAIKENKKILNMTLKEMILNRPFDYINEKEGKKEKDIKKWEINKKNLEHLEDIKSKYIYKALDLENILNMKMKDIYKEYLSSDEFQKSIEELREEGYYFEYIQKYIQVAHKVIDYYN